MRMFALDVSKWDGHVDFPQIKSWGVEAVFIRVGAGYVKDAKLDEYMIGAQAVGLYRFTYFYFYPHLNYKTQAQNYTNWSAPYPIEGAMHGDYEQSSGVLGSINLFHNFCLEVDQLNAKICDIYTALYFWKSMGGTLATWVNKEMRKLWSAQWPIDGNPNVKSMLPQYTSEVLQGMHSPTLVPPWSRTHWWQYTAKLTVPGIEAKDVDGDASISVREDVLQEYNLTTPSIPTKPETYEELVDRYMKLETWAMTHGYKI